MFQTPISPNEIDIAYLLIFFVFLSFIFNDFPIHNTGLCKALGIRVQIGRPNDLHVIDVGSRVKSLKLVNKNRKKG